MNDEERKEMYKTKNEEQFNDFLLKYHPDYDDITMSEWVPEIYQYCMETILELTEDMAKFMEENIIEYNQM